MEEATNGIGEAQAGSTGNAGASAAAAATEGARVDQAGEAPAAQDQPADLTAVQPGGEGSEGVQTELHLNSMLLGSRKGSISRQVASKWVKTSVLRQDARIAKHIPDTRIFSAGDLSAMLNAYGKVVVKPVVGTGGVGVIMIDKSGDGYLMRHKSRHRRFAKFEGLVAALKRIKRRRRYLIQRGISLATIGGRPIDYRVKMVKQRKSWKTTAMVGRLARPGLFVTNLCRGGTLLPSSVGISRSLPSSSVRAKKQEMRQLTRLCIASLERAFPNVGQLGFDYGIDRSGMIWIFEVNTRPH
ncbi:YheC/YheD family protein [Paenibacillus koleovorans]|uniref:YheC/YheD family protein n=1 Tax=Paenibacillus koleovorans TaxID=121608 RepID=UPI0027D78106|nr:YheC/YheD family protein [Paenibacillus koleovorans]